MNTLNHTHFLSACHPWWRLACLAALTGAVEARAEKVRCLTEPISDVEMSVIVPGTVDVIHYGEGSFVEKGTVVLELESRSEQLDVERRRVLVDTLKANLERSEKLLETTSSISREEVDTARGEFRVAAIELEMAGEALERRMIRAPISGIVTELPMEVGEYCEPPQILLRMVDPREFYCVANIDPVTALRLKIDTPVRFERTGNGSTGPLDGRVVFISPVVDPASGLLRVKALFANPDGAVRPGEAGLLELPD